MKAWIKVENESVQVGCPRCAKKRRRGRAARFSSNSQGLFQWLKKHGNHDG